MKINSMMLKNLNHIRNSKLNFKIKVMEKSAITDRKGGKDDERINYS